MLKYIIKRILWIIPILIGVTIVVFTILYFSPGDPAYLALGDNATPEAVEAYRIEMGINGTYWERLGRTLLGLFQGDLGISYRSRTPVLNELLVRFSVTFNISAWSIVLGIILGIFFGIVAALKQNTILDSLCTGCALFGISMPMFWQGLMLILIFSVGLGWLPASGYGNSWTQMIMPVVALGVNSSATIMRTTRSSMLEVMRQDYIRTPNYNGYRSLHLDIRVPVYLSNRTEYVMAEIQIRTIAMDFWASLEHDIRYKADKSRLPAGINEEMFACADKIAEIDQQMQDMYQRIKASEQNHD